MIQPPITTDTDPLLLPYLTAPDDAQADEELTRLLDEQVEPLAKSIISYKLRAYFDRSSVKEADDVFGDAVVNLLSHLSQLKYETQSSSIRNFRSYVAVTTYRACSEHLRRRYPQRHRLKNKLRYFLNHQSGFALWEAGNGEWLAGFGKWRGQTFTDESRRKARQLPGALEDFQSEALPGGSAQGLGLRQLLTTVFNRTDAPLELDSLVCLVAELWQVKDIPHSDLPGDEDRLAQLVDSSSIPTTELDHRGYLGTLWAEIKQLSPKHCAALLLNLRDEQNESALDLFLFTGTASLKEIATALGKTEMWLAEVWNGLPLADALIAQHLALERQQIINLRRTARLRLARRMSEIFSWRV